MGSILREAFGTPCYNCPFRHPSKKFNFTNDELDMLVVGDNPCHATRKAAPVVDHDGGIIGAQMLAMPESRECAGAKFYREKKMRYRNYP